MPDIHRIEERVIKLEQAIVQIETRTGEQYKNISEKLDKLIMTNERAAEQFASKEMCKIITKQQSEDINNIGTKIRNHIKSHMSTMQKYLFWGVTTLIMTFFFAKFSKLI